MTGRATGPWSPIRPWAGAVIALAAMAGAAIGQPLPPIGKRTPPPKKMPPLRPDSGAANLGGPASTSNVHLPDDVVARPVVAVIDLRADTGGDSRTLARALSTAVARRPELAQVADSTVAAALIGPLVTESTAKIRAARGFLDEAREAMSAEFNLDKALDRAQSGQRQLLETLPTAESINLLADLVFVEGQVQFADGAVARARLAFALVQRLSPGRTLDRAEHPPALIDAFTAAATPPAGEATLEITATGTVWLDGQLQGEGTRTVTVAPGMHVIVASGAEVLPKGDIREVAAGQTAKVTLAPVVAPPEVLAARARAALIAAPDPIARAGAMRRIAEIIAQLPGNLEMTDAVLVTSDPKGNAAVQLWRNRAPGFGLIRAIERPLLDSEADKLVDPLVPRKRAPRPVEIPDLPPPEPKPWYSLSNWYMPTAIGGGVILAIVASVFLPDLFGADLRTGWSVMQAPTDVEGRR
jgi:hypothetical protein